MVKLHGEIRVRAKVRVFEGLQLVGQIIKKKHGSTRQERCNETPEKRKLESASESCAVSERIRMKTKDTRKHNT